ncbi:FAD-binding oxidoreductase [Actinokineospora enzanensis]|uniref:FAD-binding oxidoreductase n=1 Tax=Actinokineospora enzanensis TaxID=155975 RepID=UPI003CCB9A37
MATVGSCSDGENTAGTGNLSGTTTSAVTTTSRPAPVPPDWNALRERLGGALVQSSEAGYDEARRSVNTLYDNHSPLAIAYCTTVDHIKACVELARVSHTPLAARSGGHSYTGYSVPDGGLVVDVRRMSGVDVRPDGTVMVGAGARLIDVYTALGAAGRCLPAGSCPTVGIAGLTLGGGLGVVARKYGLTCDRLVGAQVVTADGALHTVSQANEPDLFWALRGGGGGNFGIATSFTFSTEPSPDVTVFHLDYRDGAAATVVGAWQELFASAPDELWAAVALDGGSPVKCSVSGCFVGPQSGLMPLLDRLARTAGKPSNRLVQQKSYLDAMRYFAGCGNKTAEQCAADSPRSAFMASSRILSGPLTDPAALVALVDGRPDLNLLVDSLGGAVARIAPEDTAFPHRAALGTVQIYHKTTKDGQAAAARAVAETRDALARLGVRGGYVNYIEAAMPDWGVAYYGANLNRLGSVARRYDPDDVFSFPQSIQQA